MTADTSLALGKTHRALGDDVAAERELTRALAEYRALFSEPGPDHARTLLELGELTLGQRRWDVAREHLNAAASSYAIKTAPRKKREQVRREQSKPILDAFIEWCDEQAAVVLDDTPISRAIGYARNQRIALARFVDDGRLPLDNNISERNLRREVLGRKNWLFLGSDEGARVNTIFVSLLASCQLHGIEPWAYLRDIFCLLRWWPRNRILELAPAFWKQTLQQPETPQRLAAAVVRAVTLADHPSAA